jgi:NADH-quinone oxidoreductase subunit C
MSDGRTPVADREIPRTGDPPPTEHPLVARLRGGVADAVRASDAFRGDATAIVGREKLLETCRFLRDDSELRFDLLLDVTAVDYLGRSPRFEVVYHFYSLPLNHRIRIKVALEESDPRLPSLVPIWAGANWLERETWDLYGIVFEGHPDLRRIYLYEEFQGHPLRKDYPKEKRQPLIGPGSAHSAVPPASGR